MWLAGRSSEGHASNTKVGVGRRQRDLVVGRWTCNPEVLGSNPAPCHWIDLSSVVPNSTPPRFVNS